MDTPRSNSCTFRLGELSNDPLTAYNPAIEFDDRFLGLCFRGVFLVVKKGGVPQMHTGPSSKNLGFLRASCIH